MSEPAVTPAPHVELLDQLEQPGRRAKLSARTPTNTVANSCMIEGAP
jgi:hypothetical protein